MKLPHPLQPSFLDALLSLPKIYGESVSRDGQWVAWMWLGTSDSSEVYAVKSDGTAPVIKLAASDQNVYLVSWLPSSDGVIVAHDNNGNERLQLFKVMLTNPNVLIPLTEPFPNYYIRGGQIHPNGRWLVYGANFDVETSQEIEATWVYRHDLVTGERTPLAKPIRGAYFAPLLNSSGTHILYNRKDRHPSGFQLWVVDIEGNHNREILNFGDELKIHGSWFPDGNRILVRAEAETYYRIGVYDLATKDLQWLIDDPDRNIESVHAPFRSSQIVVNEVKEARLISTLLDIQSNVETPIKSANGTAQLIAPLTNGRWVAKVYAANKIMDLVQCLPEPGRFTQIGTITHVDQYTSIQIDDLVPAEDFRWNSVDGLEIQGWLYRTRDSAKGTIVCVHGGPTWHSEDVLDDQIQYLVSQEFNVLDPNYRGSTGFYRAYTEAIKQDGWGGKEQDDIRTGIETLIAKGIAEYGKVGITGTSYGGYSAWHAITHFPLEIVRAAAPICGMTDLVIDYETTRPDLRPYSVEMMGGTPQQIPDRYYDRSPINFIKDIKGHLLIVQGLQDPNVTPENLRHVQAALNESIIPYEVLTFDNEGHGIYRNENLKVLYPRLVKFFSEAFSKKLYE